jgi:hypothetical protein
MQIITSPLFAVQSVIAWAMVATAVVGESPAYAEFPTTLETKKILPVVKIPAAIPAIASSL